MVLTTMDHVALLEIAAQTFANAKKTDTVLKIRSSCNWQKRHGFAGF
jgi:hypothetical protein